MNTKPLIAVLLAVASAGAFAQAASAPATPRIDQRQANQAARIEQGEKSGALTQRETRRLDAQQQRIAGAEAKARADGRVTPAERHQLHRRQAHASRAIHRQKHDAQTAAPKAAAPVKP